MIFSGICQVIKPLIIRHIMSFLSLLVNFVSYIFGMPKFIKKFSAFRKGDTVEMCPDAGFKFRIFNDKTGAICKYFQFLSISYTYPYFRCTDLNPLKIHFQVQAALQIYITHVVIEYYFQKNAMNILHAHQIQLKHHTTSSMDSIEVCFNAHFLFSFLIS